MTTILSALLMIGPAHADGPNEGPSAAVLAKAAPSILRVTASGCPSDTASSSAGGSKDRAATGFPYESSNQVITAMHVILGCTSIKIGYRGKELDARIIHVLPKADLVMLEVTGAPSVKPLELTDRVGDVKEKVDVYGFGMGVAKIENNELMIQAPNDPTTKLREATNDKVRDEIRKYGFPDLDTLVLRVEGHLLPGHSGAPVIDYTGKVIAIGSGGLEQGTVGIGWAIRSSYVAELVAAPATMPLKAGRPTSSFAYVQPTESSGTKPVRCGDGDFVWTRRRTLKQLVASSDDQTGFYKIAQSTGQPLSAFDNLSFDIWTESGSGAGLALPAGSDLTPEGSDCVADIIDGQLEIRVSASELPTVDRSNPSSLSQWRSQAQSASLDFEQSALVEFGQWNVIDPAFSYALPLVNPTFDVRRKLFIGQVPDNFPHAVFVTLLAAQQAFIGIATINHKYLPAYAQPADEFQKWVAAAFGTHLSTVPPATQ